MSRFKENITPESIYNSIKAVKNRPFLLVEGESDMDFFVKFIDEKECTIKPTFGNSKLIRVFDIAKEDETDSIILGVIDADFRRIDDNLPTYDNVFLTDTHDLETMIMQSETLELVVNKFCRKRGTEAQKDAYLQARKQTLREFLLNLALPIAHFKYLSDTKNYGFKFKRNPLEKKDDRPDFRAFFNKEKMEIDVKELIKEIRLTTLKKKQEVLKRNPDSNFNPRLDISDEILLKELENIKKTLVITDELIWEVCNGHHITNILSVALLKALSDYNSQAGEVDSKLIENELITNYDSMYFKETTLYAQMKNWEIQHLVIFRNF